MGMQYKEMRGSRRIAVTIKVINGRWHGNTQSTLAYAVYLVDKFQTDLMLNDLIEIHVGE